MADAQRPGRVAIGVVWTRRRMAATARFGVLVVDGGDVTLIDRDDSSLFAGPGPELRVAAVGRSRILLRPSDDASFYVAGFTAQDGRARRGRELIERHDAHAAPPPLPTLDPRAWKRITRSSSPYSTATNRMIQRVAWQPLILRLLWGSGAQPVG